MTTNMPKTDPRPDVEREQPRETDEPGREDLPRRGAPQPERQAPREQPPTEATPERQQPSPDQPSGQPGRAAPLV